MRFFRGSSEKQASPSSSLDNPQYAQNYPGAHGYGDDSYPAPPQDYDDNLQVQCPPHTTERKLVTKIDWHVIPFLCIMYLLAFLGK